MTCRTGIMVDRQSLPPTLSDTGALLPRFLYFARSHTDETDETAETDEPDETNDADEPDQTDDTDDTDEPDETDDTDDTDDTDNTNEPDETDETNEIDETGETDEPDEIDETDETDVLDENRANGNQVYMIGWARYEGVGPEVASESAILAGAASSSSGNNATAGADLGDGGVAGSSVPKQDWLADVDGTSAIFGVLTALGHVLGFAFYVLTLSAAVQLFRSQFRSNRTLFRSAARASVVLCTWLVGVTAAGFYLATQKGFAKTVIAVLNEEGFLCQVWYVVQVCRGWAGRPRLFHFCVVFFTVVLALELSLFLFCFCSHAPVI